MARKPKDTLRHNELKRQLLANAPEHTTLSALYKSIPIHPAIVQRLFTYYPEFEVELKTTIASKGLLTPKVLHARGKLSIRNAGVNTTLQKLQRQEEAMQAPKVDPASIPTAEQVELDNSRYTPDQRYRLAMSVCDMIEQGVDEQEACKHMELNYWTFRAWIRPYKDSYDKRIEEAYKLAKSHFIDSRTHHFALKGMESLTALIQRREYTEVHRTATVLKGGKVKPKSIKEVTKVKEPDAATVRMVATALLPAFTKILTKKEDQVEADPYALRTLSDEELKQALDQYGHE